jgi:hypothetical protein
VKCIADATPARDTKTAAPTTVAAIRAVVDRMMEPPVSMTLRG